MLDDVRRGACGCGCAIVAGIAVGSGCVQSVGARERFMNSNSSAVAHRPGDRAERMAMWPVVGQSPAVAMAGTRGSDSGALLAGVDAGR